MSQPLAPATPPHVLVVDDDVTIREALVELFESEGYSVAGAVHRADALAQARVQRPDAVVLDLMMPVMDGHEFLVAKRGDARLSAIPVIVMTAAEMTSIQGEDVTTFFNKPMDFDALLSAVARSVAGV